jgi:hypothetical protein
MAETPRSLAGEAPPPETPKCWAAQILLISTRLDPVECCFSVWKAHGFGRLRLRTGITEKARKSGAPAHGAETPKCWAAQILLISTQIYPAKRCLSERKPRGFGLLRLRDGIAEKARKSGTPAHGAETPKCRESQILLIFTRLDPVERPGGRFVSGGK